MSVYTHPISHILSNIHFGTVNIGVLVASGTLIINFNKY